MSIDRDPTARTGDDEPEDGWDRNDPPWRLLDNLRRRVALLVMVREFRARDRHRIAQLHDDLVYVIDRLRLEE